MTLAIKETYESFALQTLGTVMDLASSNAIDMLSSEKKCPFSKIAGHETAIELQPERNMLSFHVTTMVIARELNHDTNRKEWFTSFKKLLNGKCQRQNSSDVLDFWHSLQTSVKELSVKFSF